VFIGKAIAVGYVKLIDFVRKYRSEYPNASKQEIAAATAKGLNLRSHRSVYSGDGFVVRFSESKKSGFSGTICALRAIQQFDHLPFVVALIRPHMTEYFLANSTFINKVSHSSQLLAVDRIRGSINGSNIIRAYDGIDNRPENFDWLFSIHQEFEWNENVQRLVDATGAIAGHCTRFVVTDKARDMILRAPSLAASIVNNPIYLQLKEELGAIVSERSEEILNAAAIDNVNVRGNQIEQLITGGINEHRLADMIRHVDGIELQLEIKTKLMDRASSPKAYNIDKALATLSAGHSLIAFCFVGVDIGIGQVTSSTVSIFDRAVLAATRIQFHWAGRNSRGVTQLTGNLAPLFSPTYAEQINVVEGQRFLERLLNL
jgi:hypothetical protein